ncbi:MAG: phBC6A51 family helix-turn-helix protein [bacterium]|nr:phBC6A51 family helix-turn-helix protein [bacterium]
MSRERTIKVRQVKARQALLEQLERTPIIELACDKVGISRTTFYRWIHANKDFAKTIEKSLVTGREFINDLAESQVLSLIKQGEIKAIRLWLTHNSARYANKLELSGTVATKPELSTEQKKVIRRALKLSSIGSHAKPRKGKTHRKDSRG